MAKYRKKPVVIDAVQFSSEMAYSLVCEFVGKQLQISPEGIVIPTLEGDMVARVGDYIIRGVKGEFYPCKPEIFHATYDPAEDDVTQEQWDEAVKDAKEVLEMYKEIPSGIFGAMNISEVLARYDRGERTKELYEDLKSIQ